MKFLPISYFLSTYFEIHIFYWIWRMMKLFSRIPPKWQNFSYHSPQPDSNGITLLLNFHHHQCHQFPQRHRQRFFKIRNLLLLLNLSVVNRLVDSLLEEIGEQLESLGLDPLPIPDIRIPYSLDTVSLSCCSVTLYNTKYNTPTKDSLNWFCPFQGPTSLFLYDFDVFGTVSHFGLFVKSDWNWYMTYNFYLLAFSIITSFINTSPYRQCC